MCGNPQPDNPHWESRHSEVKLVCPKDGINGGDFTGDWCRSCRDKLLNFITTVFPVPEAEEASRIEGAKSRRQRKRERYKANRMQTEHQ